MNIPLLSMALSQGHVQQQASLSMMSKVMDQTKSDANFINVMMKSMDTKALQHAAQPHLGGNIDLKR